MAGNNVQNKKVLFICLGNICRSPIAEAVFSHVLKERNITSWTVDSAGIGDWHAGNSPDHRAIATMKKHNIPMKHFARQVKKTDFNCFDYIFGMDTDNMKDMKSVCPKGAKAEMYLFGEYDPQNNLMIRDPYYDDDDDASGFEDCYEQCLRCSNGFLDSLSST